jgi:hypothetical protein
MKRTYNVGDELFLVHHSIIYTIEEVVGEIVTLSSGITRPKTEYRTLTLDRMISEGVMMHRV